METEDTEQIVQSIRWEGGKVHLLDQTQLPEETVYRDIETVEQMHEAIRKLRIRGAPAIGIAAAYGFYLGIKTLSFANYEELRQKVDKVADYLSSARPTAVNLQWALDRMKKRVEELRNRSIPEIKQRVLQEAKEIHETDKQICRRIGERGADLVPGNSNILTHCNTGSLATGRYGTALSVIYHANKRGRQPHVWVDETRPLLQGARLTTWELMQAGIDCTLIADATAGILMQQAKVDLVIVGTDRVAANGDVANKIGTYPLALLANHHNIPFYVAAPLSSVDTELSDGDQIPIEERSGKELTQIAGKSIAPDGVSTYTPAFDITPHTLVDGLITEEGILMEDFEEGLKKLKRQEAGQVDAR